MKILPMLATAMMLLASGTGHAKDSPPQVCFNEAKADKNFLDSCIGMLDYNTFTAGKPRLPAAVKVDYCTCILNRYRIVAIADQDCGFGGRDTQDMLFRRSVLREIYKLGDPECGIILLRSGFRLY